MVAEALTAMDRQSATGPAAALSWWRQPIEGLSWKGLAILLAVCVTNALRRSMNDPVLWNDPLQWLFKVWGLTLTGTFVALPVVVGVVFAVNHLRLNGWRLGVALALIVAASTLVGCMLNDWYESEVNSTAPSSRGILYAWLRYVPLAALFAGAYVYFRRKSESLAAMQQAEADRAQLAQRMAEARLTVLQAQIEPHFLFNTLANVRRLYQTDPAAAREMLDNLMRYLTVALPRMRAPESTLGREVALVEAYLEIQRIRMGRRLAYRIDIPEHLRNARFPPMMLLTLVENAIKHALNPLPEGGSIDISARAGDGMLRVEVSDSGAGFLRASGPGTGLANARARLAAQFGPQAGLTLKSKAPQGVQATIALPLGESAVPVGQSV